MITESKTSQAGTYGQTGNHGNPPLTDQKLHQTFVEYGNNAKTYVRKCIGLLPEIYQRKIWQQKGFSSIFEYARLIAGLSDAQVRRALNLHERFESMPVLQKMLQTGNVGMSKLVCVASIATPENQRELAQKVKLLPRTTLETLVRDQQRGQELQNAEVKPRLAFGQTFVPGDKSQKDNNMNHEPSLRKNKDSYPMSEKTSPHHKGQIMRYAIPQSEILHLNEEVIQKLLELQNKGINVNELLLNILNMRKTELEREKERLAAITTGKDKKLNDNPAHPAPTKAAAAAPTPATKPASAAAPTPAAKPAPAAATTPAAKPAPAAATTPAAKPAPAAATTPAAKSSRYIAAAIRHNLHKTHGTKCSIRTCFRPAIHIHHTQRFGLSQTHDPNYLAPLCKDHHRIAHSLDQKYNTIRIRAASAKDSS